jgi:fumarylpyruvate hydrolase
MEYTFEPVVPSLPVIGSERRFPVGRIYCVGLNYAEFSRSLGNDPQRNPPFFFMKPADALVPDGTMLPFPVQTDFLDTEVELVVAIGRGGRDIPAERSLEHVFGYAVGFDHCRRDLQRSLKKAGRPWEMGKAFDNSAPCTAVTPAAQSGHPATGAIWLKINGETRQSNDLSGMIWNVPEIIAHLSCLVLIKPGDLIFTGTPAGAGLTRPGDRLEGCVEGIGTLGIAYRK